MVFRERDVVVCPVDECGAISVHMCNTWVIGSSVISADGRTSKSDDSLLRLFPRLVAYRGSRVVILFEAEQCDHKWFTVTKFHKGETLVWDLELTEEEIEKEFFVRKEMWRD